MPRDLGPTAVTIGNFDGVHRGHAAILEQLTEAAAERSLAPVALTFWPHPRHVCVAPGEPMLVTGRDARDALLADPRHGLAGVLDLEFTLDFAQHSAEDFVRIFLVEGLGMRCIVMGADSLFGRGNEGDISTMRKLGERYGFEVIEARVLGAPGGVPEPAVDDVSARVSSSAVRDAIESGDMAAAARMLGRPHFVSDVVHHGFKRGREMGFPTANLGRAPDGMVPCDGVYAGYLTVIEQIAEHADQPALVRAPATISIGTNPTFAAEGERAPRMVEAYVHGRTDLDLYGDTVLLEFVDRQRPTLRFDGVDALVEQMNEDKRVTRRTLAADPLGLHLPG